MTVRLFIGNLPYNVSEAELRELFSAVGPLSYVSLPTDRETGKVRGFAFLEFTERAHAEEAVRRFHNQLFKGRPLSVSEARPREDRPRSGGQATAPSPRPAFTPGEPAMRKAEPNFGPDAPPRQSRHKSKSPPRSERPPKGPLREVVKGQFFGGEDDDAYEDDLDEDNFASRVDPSEGEEST